MGTSQKFELLRVLLIPRFVIFTLFLGRKSSSVEWREVRGLSCWHPNQGLLRPKAYGQLFARGGGAICPKISQVAQIVTKKSKRNEGHMVH